MRTMLALLACLAVAAPLWAGEVPKMTREEALAYLEEEGNLSLDPSNLVLPIMNGNPELLEALLSAGVDVNDPAMIKPALRLAAGTCAGKRVDVETMLTVIEVLLAHGAKPNDPSDKELSALMVAAQHCPAPIVSRLVKAGADMKFRASLGYTPLSMAFIMTNLDAAEVMIDAGARLSAEAVAKLADKQKDNERYHALLKKAQAK
ncbi:MAG TPA: ankyrin repeat domain-containing protein [Thermoanaerobaculia bacterium]|nr:ankyrin repeat domain-containing protein [Thermoanaerobaculia bacterium]